MLRPVVMGLLSLEGSEQEHLLPLGRILERVKPGDRPQMRIEVSGLKASVFFVCPKTRGAGKFIYDMISRWIVPGKTVSIALFFVTDFEWEGEWTAGEVAFVLKDLKEVGDAKRGFKFMQKELEMGLSSPFFAERVMELKGLSGREKLARVQERLGCVCERFGLDKSVLLTLQQFASKCSPLFIQERSARYLTRLVMHLDAGLDKCMPVRIDSPLGMRCGLGLVIDTSFCLENQVFEQAEATRFAKAVFPKVEVINCSYEEMDGCIYLEITKKNGDPFTLQEIEKLKRSWKPQVFAKKFDFPVFVPRNEEEVMRRLMSLSQELRFVKDLPQVTITFDRQLDGKLCFTVLLVRLGTEPDLADLIGPEFVVERVRKMGVLRSRYEKQAHVIRIEIKAENFLRGDDTIDTLQARQKVSELLKEKIGAFRDFNGGIIARELENFEALKSFCQNVPLHKLQAFFYSLEPMHLRSVLPPKELKALYLKRKEKVT